MSPSLQELQRWMRSLIIDPSAIDRSDLSFLAEMPPFSRAHRMNVYSYAYFERLLGVLREDFEKTAALLSEDAFRALIADYLRAFPSRTATVAEVGRHLPEFSRSYPLLEEHPALADAAAFDWATMECFFADPAPAWDPSSLAAVSPKDFEKLHFRLAPEIRLLRLGWSVHLPKVVKRECRLLMRRDEGWPEVEEMEPIPFALLEGFREGLPLGGVIERALGADTEKFSGYFGEWVSQGVLSGLPGLELKG